MSRPCKDIKGKRFYRLVAVCRNNPEEGKEHWKSMWRCECDCGKVKTAMRRNLLTGITKSCGCATEDYRKKLSRGGNEHPNWKGGRTKSPDGYIIVSLGSGRKRPEHCLVMEDHLGRKLTEDETVHHRNGIRDDNRLENLELWASSHPYGQRVEDLVTWAKAILNKYHPWRTVVE